MAAAFAIDDGASEQLTIVCEAKRELVRQAQKRDQGWLELFQQHLRDLQVQIASEFGIKLGQVAFLPIGEFPKTSSGKVQRRACRTLFEHRDSKFLPLPGLNFVAHPSTSPQSVVEVNN